MKRTIKRTTPKEYSFLDLVAPSYNRLRITPKFDGGGPAQFNTTGPNMFMPPQNYTNNQQVNLNSPNAFDWNNQQMVDPGAIEWNKYKSEFPHLNLKDGSKEHQYFLCNLNPKLCGAQSPLTLAIENSNDPEIKALKDKLLTVFTEDELNKKLQYGQIVKPGEIDYGATKLNRYADKSIADKITPEIQKAYEKLFYKGIELSGMKVVQDNNGNNVYQYSSPNQININQNTQLFNDQQSQDQQRLNNWNNRTVTQPDAPVVAQTYQNQLNPSLFSDPISNYSNPNQESLFNTPVTNTPAAPVAPSITTTNDQLSSSPIGFPNFQSPLNISNVSPVQKPVIKTPVFNTIQNNPVVNSGTPSNMLRAPGYQEGDDLTTDALSTTTQKPLGSNTSTPSTPVTTSTATPVTQNTGTPSNMMRVAGYDDAPLVSIDPLNPPQGVDPMTGVDPRKMEWLKDPVRNQMTELKDIQITPEKVAAEPSHYKPYDINPFTTGLNILNAGLNTIGGMRYMGKMRNQENLNSFITQQPEAIYPNKRMLYGDKTMFAKYGGEYAEGGMYPEGGSVYDPEENIGELVQYKKGGIYIKPENKGKFTAWASSHGMSVQEAASHVMANKDKYSSTTVKRANFAKNASKWNHEDGGEMYSYGGHYIPQDVPYLAGKFIPNPIDLQEFKKGGMIKRADGTYSKRGLWDNIRDNKGSGKKPTKEMLKQEKKIKKDYKAGGEYMEGNEYEISGEELDRLRSLGYDVEMI